MERLKHMKEMLMAQVESQLGHLETVDAEELGEVIDMIKDLDEALYYCTITKAMEEKDQEKTIERHYYTERPYVYNPPMYPERDMDREYGRMYYGGNGNRGSSGNGSSNASNGGSSNTGSAGSNMSSSSGSSYYGGPYEEYPLMDWRDSREGRSPKSRKMYMEAKETHQGKAAQLKELEKYVGELTDDLMDMIKDASPEEQSYLGNRVSALATKINKLNSTSTNG